jgi:beta-glucosidase-like glycosyl hydrolase
VQRGLEAGVDAFLVCSDPALRDEVLRRLERTSDAAVEAPLRRVIALKEGFARRAAAVPEEISEPPYPEHEALARRFVPPASSGPRGSRV